MLRVCQQIRPSSLRDRENQATFAAWSPTAMRDIRPFRFRRKQIPETSRSGTSITRRTCSRCFELTVLIMDEIKASDDENALATRPAEPAWFGRWNGIFSRERARKCNFDAFKAAAPEMCHSCRGLPISSRT